MARTLLVLLLLGMTGCAPCSDIDARIQPLPVGTPDPAVTHIALRASAVALQARAGQTFTPGQATIGDTTVAWDTLGLKLSAGGSSATVGLRVTAGPLASNGSLTFPVALVTEERGAGFRVSLRPDGPSALDLPGSHPGLIEQIDPLREGWLAPLFDFGGWYTPGDFMPLSVRPAVVAASVVTVEASTGFALPSLAGVERALRPGMADDFTLAIAMPVLSALARGGWRPVPVGGIELPSPTAPAGWSATALPPHLEERGLRIPVIARAADRCAFTEVSVETSPAIGGDGIVWRDPRAVGAVASRGEVGDALQRELITAALASFVAPVTPVPLTGPSGFAASVRIPRTVEDTLLLDGLLGPSKTHPLQPRPDVIPPKPGRPANP